MVAKKPDAKKNTGPKPKKASPVAMQGSFDISSATEFKETLEKSIKSSPELIIEAGKLEKITTPCIQLLLSASQSVMKKKGKLILQDPSKEMEKAFTDIGFIDQFNEWKENG